MGSEVFWLPNTKLIGLKPAVSSASEKVSNLQNIESYYSSQDIHGASPSSPNPTRRTAIERLAKDMIGKELAPDATIWELYQEEAKDHDSELVNGRNQNLDMMLLFAGLFSAVLTGFLVESKKMLQQDPMDASLALLLYIAQSQQRVEDGTSRSVSPTIEIPPFQTPIYARWINALWFLSLTLSLCAALIAMLAKEWLTAFVATRPRSPYQHALLHQSRLDGMNRWYALHIIDLLPTVLHFALLLFSVGLVIYLWTLDYAIAIVIIVVVGATISFYGATAALASIFKSCPFVTQISTHIRGTSIFNPVMSRGHTPSESQASEGTMLEKLQAIKWLTENARDPTISNCLYQALAEMELSHAKPTDASDTEPDLTHSTVHTTTSIDRYAFLTDIFHKICDRIPQMLSSESGQLSASQGMLVSRYAHILPKLVYFLETYWIQAECRSTSDTECKHWVYNVADTPSTLALNALDHAWGDDRPYLTADTYALLTAAELNLIKTTSSIYYPKQPGEGTAMAPQMCGNNIMLDTPLQDWLVVDMADVEKRKTSLLDLRARYSRALFRVAIQIAHHVTGRIQIRTDALVHLLDLVRLAFSHSPLNPKIPMSTHQQQEGNIIAPPHFRSLMVGIGSVISIDPLGIGDEGALLIGVMRIVSSTGGWESPELAKAARRALSVVARILLEQWLNLTRERNHDNSTQATVSQALYILKDNWEEYPTTPDANLGQWTMDRLLVIACIANLCSGCSGIDRLSEYALRGLYQLSEGYSGRQYALDTAANSLFLIPGLIHAVTLQAKGQNIDTQTLHYFIKWLLFEAKGSGSTLLQHLDWIGDRLRVDRDTSTCLGLLALWAQAPNLVPELERFIHHAFSNTEDGTLDALLISNGLSTIVEVGCHAEYTPSMVKIIVQMIESSRSLGQDYGACFWADSSDGPIVSEFLTAVEFALKNTEDSSPQHSTLLEHRACAVSTINSTTD